MSISGLPDEIRTHDLQSRSLMRYPAVPRVVTFSFPEKKKITKKKRIGYRRSQPRHSEKDIKLLDLQIIGKEKDNQKEKNWLSPFTKGVIKVSL